MIERFMCYVNGISWNGLGLMIFRLVLISLIALVLARVLEKFMDTFRRRLIASGVSKGDTASETAKRTETIVRLIRQASLIVLWSMVVLVLLKEVGVEIAPILAGAGIVGLAVGFGAQNLVRDVISGFFFILEDQVRVGDVVVVNGTSGLVEEINFRTIILRDQSLNICFFLSSRTGFLATSAAFPEHSPMPETMAYRRVQIKAPGLVGEGAGKTPSLADHENQGGGLCCEAPPFCVVRGLIRAM